VIAALGLTGYVVWRAQQKPTAATSKTTPPHYLVIKEWGVKLPLSSDFSYTMTAAGANLQDAREIADAKAIQCSLDEVSAGRIFRSKDIEPGPGIYSPRVNGYYYVLALGSQAICLDAPGHNYDPKMDLINQQADADDALLKAAIHRLTAAKQ
jgi:hypothetical protein